MKEQTENAPTTSEPETNAIPSQPPVERQSPEPPPDKEPWVSVPNGLGDDVPQKLSSETGVN